MHVQMTQARAQLFHVNYSYVAMIYFESNTQKKLMNESFMSNKIGVDHPIF